MADSPLKDLLEHLQSSRAQSLLARVDELRSRLIRLMILITVLICVGFFFAQDIFLLLKMPLVQALPKQKEVLHFAGPMEVMMSYMKVSFLLAVTLAAPYAFLQIWRYVGPALPVQTRKLVVPFVTASIVLFASGVAFCFFLMLPVGIKWLLEFGGDQALPVIMVDDYIDLVTFMLLAFGAAFQFPLIVILLERLGLISEEMLTKHRGGMLLGILIVAAIVTPSPDPFSQVAMTVPMYVLFEVAIIVIRWLKKRDALPPVKVTGP